MSDHDRPTWDRVFSDLKVLTQQDYDGCDFATLVVSKKGIPDVCHPIICRRDGPSPSGDHASTS